MKIEIQTQIFENDVLLKIRDRIEHARKEHPAKEWQGKGIDWAFKALRMEFIELIYALDKETPERVKDELLDVIVVAIRMYKGEWE